jgi:hypothetical protein
MADWSQPARHFKFYEVHVLLFDNGEIVHRKLFYECNTSGLATFKHVTYTDSYRHINSQLSALLPMYFRCNPFVLSSPRHITVKSDSSDTLGDRFLFKSYVSFINLHILLIKQIIQYGNCEPVF